MKRHPGRHLSPCIHAQLLPDVLEVPVDGALGYEQTRGDLAVGQAFRDQARDLHLPAAEPDRTASV